MVMMLAADLFETFMLLLLVVFFFFFTLFLKCSRRKFSRIWSESQVLIAKSAGRDSNRDSRAARERACDLGQTPKSPQWSNFFAKPSALVWEFSKLCSDWLQTDFYLTWSSSKSLVLLSSAWIPFAVWTTNETNRVREQLVTVRPVHPTCWQQICRSVIYLKTCWCSTYAGVYPWVNFTCGATFNLIFGQLMKLNTRALGGGVILVFFLTLIKLIGSGGCLFMQHGVCLYMQVYLV